MSSAEIQAQLNSSYYLSAVSFTILFYEYLFTLDWETSRYWGTKINWPTGLFFANRYGTLLGNIPIVFQSFWNTPGTPNKIRVCAVLNTYHQFFIIVMQTIGGVMLILRTYALYERNNRILILMVTVSAAIVGVVVWSTLASGKAASNTPALPLYIGCTYEITHAQSVGLVIAWASLGGFDCMIFILTLYRALSRRHLSRLNLVTVLIRDGSIYFAVMVVSNLSNILTFVFGAAHTRGVATTFTNIISSVMISRLMLNLRDPSLSRMSTRFSESTRGTDQDGVFTSYLTPSGPVELPRSPVSNIRRGSDTEMGRDG
ncbi:hypothetical protein DFH07DRAFT_946507, partial [Mycena maculata]